MSNWKTLVAEPIQKMLTKMLVFLPTLLGVSGHLKPASKERFKTSHFERSTKWVKYLLVRGGVPHGELYQSGRNAFHINPL